MFCTQAPHTLHMRAGVKMGDASLQDSVVSDGLTDAFHNYHMGITGRHKVKKKTKKKNMLGKRALFAPPGFII